MSQSTIVSSGKNNYVISAAMSFMGVLAAVPVVMMLFSPNAPASASSNNGSDYDKFAYAYTQGYMASAGNVTAASMDTCGLPVGGMGSVGGDGATATTVSAGDYSQGNHNINVAVRPSHSNVGGSGNVGGGGNVSPSEMAEIIRNSYNTYTYVKSTTNTNSNNSIGSGNTTSTSVAVSDSRNVDIDTENESEIENEVKNVAISDSFNKDSHDTTTTTTTVINESFNEKDVEIDESFNEEKEVEIDDSFNEEVEVEITNERPGLGLPVNGLPSLES